MSPRDGRLVNTLQHGLITTGGILMAIALLSLLLGCATEPTPWPAGKPTDTPMGCEALKQRTHPDEC